MTNLAEPVAAAGPRRAEKFARSPRQSLQNKLPPAAKIWYTAGRKQKRHGRGANAYDQTGCYQKGRGPARRRQRDHRVLRAEQQPLCGKRQAGTGAAGGQGTELPAQPHRPRAQGQKDQPHRLYCRQHQHRAFQPADRRHGLPCLQQGLPHQPDRQPQRRRLRQPGHQPPVRRHHRQFPQHPGKLPAPVRGRRAGRGGAAEPELPGPDRRGGHPYRPVQRRAGGRALPGGAGAAAYPVCGPFLHPRAFQRAGGLPPARLL